MGTPEFWRRVLASDRVSLHYCNPAVTIRDTSSELGPGSTPKRCMRSLGLSSSRKCSLRGAGEKLPLMTCMTKQTKFFVLVAEKGTKNFDFEYLLDPSQISCCVLDALPPPSSTSHLTNAVALLRQDLVYSIVERRLS